MRGIEGLGAALEALPVHIDEVEVHFSHASIPSYPDGARPTSVVTLRGEGLAGYGEHVGWTDAEHAGFREAAAGVCRGSWQLGGWAKALAARPAYDRAALEAAAIDLALRQRGTSLLGFAGVDPGPVRYVVSFERVDDPVAAAARSGDSIELKIDADPAWSDDTWRGLAALDRIAVIDFKLGGDAADHERAHRHLPEAWIEDPRPGSAPWSPALLRCLSADAAVTSTAMLATLVPAPAAVNIKPARMGGVLEAIACLETCRQRGIPTYIGGMFEVGVGRKLSAVLAALACPDSPNDIAPLIGESPRPLRLLVDANAPGLAGDLLP
ncbi:MAG: hypothetical protein ABR587_14655 [Candidatus Binatia bacterium]